MSNKKRKSNGILNYALSALGSYGISKMISKGISPHNGEAEKIISSSLALSSLAVLHSGRKSELKAGVFLGASLNALTTLFEEPIYSQSRENCPKENELDKIIRHSEIITEARSYSNKPYYWYGGATGEGNTLDCLNFVFNIFNKLGYKVTPTKTFNIHKYTDKFMKISPSDLDVGDIVTMDSFKPDGSHLTGHVALIVNKETHWVIEMTGKGMRERALSEVTERFSNNHINPVFYYLRLNDNALKDYYQKKSDSCRKN